jgi:hypothetical protein
VRKSDRLKSLGVLVFLVLGFASQNATADEFDVRLKKGMPAGDRVSMKSFTFEETSCTQTVSYQPKQISQSQAQFVMGVMRNLQYAHAREASLDQCLDTSFDTKDRQKFYKQCKERWESAMKLVHKLPKNKELKAAHEQMVAMMEVIRDRHLAALKAVASASPAELGLKKKWNSLDSQCTEARSKVSDGDRWRKKALAALATGSGDSCKSSSHSPASVAALESSMEDKPKSVTDAVSCSNDNASEQEVKDKSFKLAVESWTECIDEHIDFRKYRDAMESYRDYYLTMEACN